MQEIDNILERTKANIGTVEAPDYILTRAKQQLENLKEIATPRFIWSTALATVVLLVFNVYVIGQQTSQDASSELEDFATSMNMNASNQLYTHE